MKSNEGKKDKNLIYIVS